MNQKCVSPPLRQVREGGVNLYFSAGCEDFYLAINSCCRGLTPFISALMVGFFGLTSTAKRSAAGNSSCKSPSRLPPSSLSIELTPVTFSSGRFRLAISQV